MSRPETGSLRFKDDWPGIFIRGDDAKMYALSLEHLIGVLTPELDDRGQLPSQLHYWAEFSAVRGLLHLLNSCQEPLTESVQEMRTFSECREGD